MREMNKNQELIKVILCQKPVNLLNLSTRVKIKCEKINLKKSCKLLLETI